MQDITNVSITVRRDNVVLTDLIGAGGTGARVYNCVIDDAWTCVVKEIDGNICAPEHVEEVKEEVCRSMLGVFSVFGVLSVL